MKKILILAGLFLATHFVSAQVWNHNSAKKWDSTTQKAYSNWVSKKLGNGFFKSLGSPYTQLRLDCADAHYALMAYFARENGLPYIIDNGKISNQTRSFDHIKNANERFVAFITYVKTHYGTESLVHRDTYPVSYKALIPGDLFMWKEGQGENATRHTYIIKNINRNGTFDVVYSTQKDAKAGNPLKRRDSYEFNKIPNNTGVDKYRWGFRRAKPAHLAAVEQDKIPGANFEQYTLAFSAKVKSNPKEYFREIKRANQTTSESASSILSRHLNGLCAALTNRVASVDEAQKFLVKTKNACMSFQDFDAYSTPKGDTGLSNEFNSMLYDYDQLSKKGNLKNADQNLSDLVFYSFAGNRSNDENQKLTQFCPVNFTAKSARMPSVTNIGMFFQALFDYEVSYHPSDNVYRRWGFREGSKTNCTEFYGYTSELKMSFN